MLSNVNVSPPGSRLRRHGHSWNLRRYTAASVDADGGYDASPPQPLPYDCGDGNILHRFGATQAPTEMEANPGDESNKPTKAKRVIHWYTPWSIYTNDTRALCAFIEVDDDEHEFELAVCGEEEFVKENFVKYFSSSRVLRPLQPQQFARLCVCPIHRKVSLLDAMDDLITSAVGMTLKPDRVDEDEDQGYRNHLITSMKTALVFSGQGSHRKGMAMDLVSSSPEISKLWQRMRCRLEENYGLSLQSIITTNPTKVNVHGDARDARVVCARSSKESLNRPESHPTPQVITHPNGVMSLTSITQPSMLAAQMIMFEWLRSPKADIGGRMQKVAAIGGHSLGEFSALCALGVFSPETAVDLVYKRGLLMEEALADASVSTKTYAMYACNPSRAKLHDDPETADDVFFVLVELVARALSSTTSFVEVVNYNTKHEQYIVSGDLVALSVLGKCMDPQFRANSCSEGAGLDGIVRTAVSSVKQDKAEGLTMDPNKGPTPDFVTSSFKRYGARNVFRRFMRGPDDGYTPSLEELTHLTLQEDGRSGLKKKSWFMPLNVEVPFHSSRLRRAMDRFLPVVYEALPDEESLHTLFAAKDASVSPVPAAAAAAWVTNLTGSSFRPLDSEFQGDAFEALEAMNVGEVRHHGKYVSHDVMKMMREGVAKSSVKDICAAVLAGQLAHPVMWVDAMDTMVMREGCRDVIEVAPARTLCDMFRRSTFYEPSKESSSAQAPNDAPSESNSSNSNANKQVIKVEARCLPLEISLLGKSV